MTKCYRLMLGDRMLPIDMRAVAADEHGDIVRIHRDEPIAFAFVYRGLPVEGRIAIGDDTQGLLRLTARIAIKRSERLHREITAIVESANRCLGPVFAMTSYAVVLSGELGSVGALTTVNLIAGIAGFLVPATPFLDLVREQMASS